MINPENIIQAIRESFGASITIYTSGNCYQLYEILKTVFPRAKAYESGGHIYTKIEDRFYDIRGKLKKNINLIEVTDDMIESLQKNKWTDKRRKEYHIQQPCFTQQVIPDVE